MVCERAARRSRTRAQPGVRPCPSTITARPTALTVVAMEMKILQIVPALHGAKMETRQGTYPIVVWALTEGDDGKRGVIGLAVAGGKSLIPPDPGTFERYTQTG
jgi:hypothetical protein